MIEPQVLRYNHYVSIEPAVAILMMYHHRHFKIIVDSNPVELLRRELAQTPLGDMAESLALLKQSQQQQQQEGDSIEKKIRL